MTPFLFRAATIVSLLCPAMGVALADENFKFEVLQDVRIFGTAYDATSLEPSRSLLGEESYGAQVGTVFSTSYQKGTLKLFGQARTTFRYYDTNEFDADLSIDEAYAELALGQSAFAFLGRKNLARGQAFGFSSIDLFTDQLALDRSLNEDRRRREVKGTDIIGLDWFVSENVTLSAVYGPEYEFLNEGKSERTQIAAEILFPSINADLAALVHSDNGKLVGGLGYSQAVGDAVVLYGDIIARQGQTQYVPSLINLATGTFVDDRNTSDIFTAMTLGLGYTTSSGQTWNFEYFYNGSGLDGSEWDEAVRIADINAGLSGSQATGNLLSLNGALETATARRHYGFVRYATPSLFGLSNVRAEATVLHQFADNSGVLGVRGELANDDGKTIGLHVQQNYGDDDSEFSFRNERTSATLYFSATF